MMHSDSLRGIRSLPARVLLHAALCCIEAIAEILPFVATDASLKYVFMQFVHAHVGAARFTPETGDLSFMPMRCMERPSQRTDRFWFPR